MQPGPGAGGIERREPPREKPGDEPRQHVAGPRRRQPRRRPVVVGGVDGTAPGGIGDHRVGAFEQDHTPRPLRRLARVASTLE